MKSLFSLWFLKINIKTNKQKQTKLTIFIEDLFIEDLSKGLKNYLLLDVYNALEKSNLNKKYRFIRDLQVIVLNL